MAGRQTPHSEAATLTQEQQRSLRSSSAHSEAAPTTHWSQQHEHFSKALWARRALSLQNQRLNHPQGIYRSHTQRQHHPISSHINLNSSAKHEQFSPTTHSETPPWAVGPAGHCPCCTAAINAGTIHTTPVANKSHQILHVCQHNSPLRSSTTHSEVACLMACLRTCTTRTEAAPPTWKQGSIHTKLTHQQGSCLRSNTTHSEELHHERHCIHSTRSYRNWNYTQSCCRCTCLDPLQACCALANW